MDYIGNAVVEKCISLIQRKDEFPLRTESKIIELIEIYCLKFAYGGVYEDNVFDDAYKAIFFHHSNPFRTIRSILINIYVYNRSTRNKIIALASEFLAETEYDIHDMLCDNDIFNDNYYRGLDDERDTKEQVEIAIRFFPDVLTKAKLSKTNEWFYPIQYLALVRNARIGNGKAVSFVPLVAQLAIELGVFEEDDRGGLLLKDSNGNNILHYLSQKSTYASDDKYLQVLVRLRRMDLLKKEDIRTLQLIQGYITFPNNTSQFLIEWDPVALLQTDIYGDLPLHFAAYRDDIQRFQMVFEYGIQYYPKKEGICLLFKKANNGETPYQIACGFDLDDRDELTDAVEGTLLRFQQRRHLLDDNSINDAGPYNVIDALLTAATDENIHLDCVYFLLRREPDVLQKLLAMEDDDDDDNNNRNNDIVGGGENDNDGNDDENHGSDSDGNKDDIDIDIDRDSESDSVSDSDSDSDDENNHHAGDGGTRISNKININGYSNTVNRHYRYQNNTAVLVADCSGKGKRKRNTNNNNNGTIGKNREEEKE